MSASVETRVWFKGVMREFTLSEQPLLKALGHLAQPDCLYRGGLCYQEERTWKGCRMVPHWKG